MKLECTCKNVHVLVVVDETQVYATSKDFVLQALINIKISQYFHSHFLALSLTNVNDTTIPTIKKTYLCTRQSQGAL